MTAQQWVGLGVRLFAIWLALAFLQNVVLIPGALERAGQSGAVWAYFMGSLYLVAAVLLWMFPMTVAHRLVPKTYDTKSLRPEAFDIAQVAVALLGLWSLLAYVLPFARFILTTLVFAGSGSFFQAMSPEARTQVVVDAIGIAVALALLLRSGEIARFILRSENGSSASLAQSHPSVE